MTLGFEKSILELFKDGNSGSYKFYPIYSFPKTLYSFPLLWNNSGQEICQQIVAFTCAPRLCPLCLPQASSWSFR